MRAGSWKLIFLNFKRVAQMKNVHICVIRNNVHIDRMRTHLSIIGINHPGPHCGKVLLTLAGVFHTNSKRNG